MRPRDAQSVGDCRHCPPFSPGEFPPENHFFPRERDRLFENLDLHGLLAEHALEFANAGLEFLGFALGYDPLVGLEALVRRVVHDLLPLEQKAGCHAISSRRFGDGSAWLRGIVEQGPLLLGRVTAPSAGLGWL